MLTSILGERLSWHIGRRVFEPAVVGPFTIRYGLKEGPHAGRHAIQHFYHQRVAPSVETTVWYEESGAVVHLTWYLAAQNAPSQVATDRNEGGCRAANKIAAMCKHGGGSLISSRA